LLSSFLAALVFSFQPSLFEQVYNYCVLNKLVDAGLIAKWKKPGYERLCSTYVINTKNYKFGTTSICRVPKYALGPDTVVEDPFTGCLGCASGPGGQRNIFGNKYGQYLAAIQVAREEERARREASKARAALEASGKGKGAASGGGDESDEEEDGPSPPGIWAANEVERNMENFEGDAAAAGAESASKRGASSEDQEEPKRARY
jgi:bud site selection protein 31